MPALRGIQHRPLEAALRFLLSLIHCCICLAYIYTTLDGMWLSLVRESLIWSAVLEQTSCYYCCNRDAHLNKCVQQCHVDSAADISLVNIALVISSPVLAAANANVTFINACRFEMPFNVWCNGCGHLIGKGVRFNAEKQAIGNYHSTKIWSFTMTAPCCQQRIEVQTDPKNAQYRVVSGGKQKVCPRLLHAACVSSYASTVKSRC